MSAQKQKKKKGKWIFIFVKLTSDIGKVTYCPSYAECWTVRNYTSSISCHRKQIKRVLLCCCGSGRAAGDIVQCSSESLVRQTLPWAQMSSQDQYGTTAPQIQTLTLHYIAPLPLQARQRQIESIYYPMVSGSERLWGAHAQKRAENAAKVTKTHTKITM